MTRPLWRPSSRSSRPDRRPVRSGRRRRITASRASDRSSGPSSGRKPAAPGAAAAGCARVCGGTGRAPTPGSRGPACRRGGRRGDGRLSTEGCRRPRRRDGTGTWGRLQQQGSERRSLRPVLPTGEGLSRRDQIFRDYRKSRVWTLNPGEAVGLEPDEPFRPRHLSTRSA